VEIPGAAEMLSDPRIGLSVLGVAGVLTGLVNALAGGGTFLSLAVLMALGLPASAANGTTRLGVAVQTLASAATFHRRGVREHAAALRLLPAMGVGAVAGAFAATRLDDALLRPVFGAVFLAWAVLLLVRPGSFLDAPPVPRRVGPKTILLAVGVGVYGGFLQAGVGFPLLALLVMQLGYDPVRANAIKAILVGISTVAALVVFAGAGQVAWAEAAVLAAGSLLGGWLGAHWQIEFGARVVRWFVLGMVAVSGAAMLGGAL
jgi:hypothetical protein